MSPVFYIFIISIFLAILPLLPLFFAKRRKDIILHFILANLLFLTPYVIQLYFLEYKGIEKLAKKIIFERSMPFENAFYVNQAKKRLKKLEGEYEKLLTGIIEFENLDRCLGFYINLLDHAKAKGNILKATTMVNPKRVWTKQARDANRRFIQRGGKIERIFLCNRSDYQTIKEEMDRHRKMGVDVSICYLENLSPDLHRDFIINEQENIAMEFRVSKGVTWTGRLIQNPRYVNELRDIFEIIKKNSQK